MIDEFAICEELKTLVVDFQAEVDGSAVVAERRYHDPDTAKREFLDVTIYPITRRKSQQGNATKFIRSTIYIAMVTKAKPTETERIDTLLRYAITLDEYFERRKVAGASNVVHEEDQFLWFPDQLHSDNKFVSLLPLEYQWLSTFGTN